MTINEIKELITKYEPVSLEGKLLISNHSLTSLVKKAYDLGTQDGKNLSFHSPSEYNITPLMFN